MMDFILKMMKFMLTMMDRVLKMTDPMASANVQLGPGLCLARTPNGGRAFEYMSGEDPFLGSTIVQPAVQVKLMNFALNAMQFVLKTMNFVLKMMNLVLKMMNLVLCRGYNHKGS